ncbi:MAG: hypothetical protein J0I06_09095 [Planctomycetes bacterium]|nr:hypothetical protein [Planctomycetota bacterium]
MLEAIANDLDAAKDAGRARRYVSFAHLVLDGKPLPTLADAERQLSEALALATGAQVRLEPVESTATVFRLDLAQLGWRTRDVFEQIERRRSVGAYPLRPFDLLLLEYPFSTALPDEGTFAKRLEPFLARKNQLRPVPFVRGDWLTAALVSGGKPTPLAEDLKSLAVLEQALARGGALPVGPPVPRPFGGAPFVGTKRADGPPLAPLSGWYAGDATSEPAPFVLAAELVRDGRAVKGVTVDQPFKFRVSSDRRVFLTLLMIQADGEVRVLPFGGGNVLQPKVERELSPGADGFVISGIVTGGPAATEYFVLFAAETELPLPVIVQSTHTDRPVWRFLLEPTAKEPFDQNKVVRKVVPISVTRK